MAPRPSALLLLSVALVLPASAQAPAPAQARQNAEFEALQAHFERVVARRHDQLFHGLANPSQWPARRDQIRASLVKMLWHDLPWPDAPPPATIAHRTQYDNYSVENLVLETAPGLFLTANLYLPRSPAAPVPVILYQCGHANKRYFTRHGAWFAQQGIAVLVMDNIEMGELEFTHHGVYAHAWFHWYSRGFSPLAVELWNARRAIDYLAARPGLDPKRIGATGRSGGGVTTFFLAAIDDRIAASAPVSGPISTVGWTRQRLSFAHCDCQFPVNSHGLLYSEVGALVAPRAQLLVNADADRGFPMNAFDELVSKIGEVYQLLGARPALTTAVAPGGHVDTEAIRLPVYSFFLSHFLNRTAPVTAEGPVLEPPAEALVCFRNGLPIDERLTRIDEALIPLANPNPALSASALSELLRREVFRSFPAQPAPLAPVWGTPSTQRGRLVQSVSFTSFEGLRVKALYSLPASAPAGTRLPALLLADHRRGIPVWGNEQPLHENDWGHRAVLVVETLDRGSRALEQNLRSFSDDDPLHHLKRQAMVTGTTIESMQVYELLRSLEFLRTLPHVDPARITIAGQSEMGINAMYAALLDGASHRLLLTSPPASHRAGPHYLGILRYTDIPAVASLFGPRLRIRGEVPAALHAAPRCDSLPACLQ
jgi:cephalosporin-C deacetylase-like acetyl esterase